MSYGTQRTLESKENDKVFVYFSDHGAAGLIAFPNGELYADDLRNTLVNMHKTNKYEKLVFYLEACESGSMFTDLPKDINIYATTAANDSESSWATYCSPDDVVNGKSIGSCLGDEYSVKWMENTESSTDLKETLQEQYIAIKQQTKGSHVQQFGDLAWVSEPIANYHGDTATRLLAHLETNKDYENYLAKAKYSKVDSREVKLHYFYNRAMKRNDVESKLDLSNELKHRRIVDRIFNKFNVNATTYKAIDFKCLKATVENFKAICQEWSEYTLKFVRNMVVACETTSEEDIKTKFTEICN